MKALISILALSVTASVLAARPHLDLDTTSAEYQQFLSTQTKKNNNKMMELDLEPEITRSMKMGQRLSQWIAKINETRTATTAIRLTSRLTRTSHPMDKPSVYNPKIIGADYNSILTTLPADMKTVLTGTAELPGTPGMDDAAFILLGRTVDRNYQSAARYKSLNPYREEYKQQAALDVRGYYYLNTNKISADDLKDVASISADKLKLITDALGRNCLNTGADLSLCDSKVSEAVKNNMLGDLYNETIADAKANWNRFFLIPSNAKRTDIIWSGNTMTVPFNTPSIAKFGPYLQDNIQDEWRFNSWALKLGFGTYANGPRLVFVSGVVPHVNGLGGNEITMDSNQPIEEYESQWTIRHEFGHVLGFPDCYHEFFDEKLDAYVNYQLDVTDLMCSRAGNFKERMYTELKETYGSN
jgi:hypothetical protein